MRRFNCLALVLVLMLASVFSVKADTAEIDLSDFLLEGTSENIDTATPNFSEMDLIASDNGLNLYFYKSGLDIYLVNQNTGKIWSNVLRKEYVDNEKNGARYASQLITVTAADKNEQINEYVLYDSTNSDIRADSEISNGQLKLDVTVPSLSLQFNVVFGLKNGGLYFRIEDSLIKEGDGKLVSITLLNNLGASKVNESGYIMYPDGSGALMNFEPYDESNAKLYQMGVYGDQDLSLDDIEKNQENNIYGARMPVYGISHNDGGFLGVISDGSDDASLYISTPGYQLSQVYRAFFTFRYRTYSSTVFNGNEIMKLVDKRTTSDREMFYYFLDGEDNNYSGMAVKYRNHLINEGVLTKRSDADKYSLSINFLCGVRKQSLFLSSLRKMTTFKDVQNILKQLEASEIKNLDLVLSGWGKGGWDTIPTNIKAESKLGGNSGLDKLVEYCDGKNIPISLDVEAIMADERYGSFNKRKNVVRNSFGENITDKSGNRYILNACDIFPGLLKKFNKKHSGAGINLLSVGELVVPNYQNGKTSTRGDVINAYEAFMTDSNKSNTRVTAQAGNSYILPYVDKIYNMPESDSGYLIADKTVPFYQMVIHGYIPYTGTYGNSHYSYEHCILKWIETGSLPSYIITKEGSDKLIDTEYDKIFSSEFSHWQNTIITTYQELSADLSELQGLTIDKHEQLSDDLVRITYSDNTKVYINYGEASAEVDGVSVAGRDYSVKGKTMQ